MSNSENNLDSLIDQVIDGSLSRKEFLELERRLLADPDLRKKFRSRMRFEANLHTEFQANLAEILPPVMQTKPRPRFSRWTLVAGMAAVLAIAFVTILSNDPETPSKTLSETPDIVATIVSEDGASWSASGLVGEGTKLSPSILSLESGLASLRFKSGAVVDLEAPVTIELLDPMRCRLSRGKAVFEVPESAVGFVVETPDGYAVDHGTRFAVSLQENSKQVEFGVLSGRISVHHDKSKEIADLRTGDMVLMTSSGIGKSENVGTPSSNGLDQNILRFPANGSETSIVHGDIRDEFLDPGLLMVKKDLPVSDENKLRRILWSKDRRSLIAFDLEGLKRQKIEEATLRLNMVPSGRGYARLLPERTTIEVYGIRDDSKLEQWDTGKLKWADAPGAVGESMGVDKSEVSFLGSFEIERSYLEGPVSFKSSELTDFVNQDQTGTIGFLLVSTSEPQDRWSLVHAFASSRHLEAAGPLLEVKVK